MRVLYSFPHTLGSPGIGTTAFHQVEGLIQQGVDVDVVCTSLGRELAGARRIVRTLSLGGRRVPHRALGVYRAYAYHDWRVARMLERKHDEIDVVHTWPAACLRTLAAARRVAVPGFREVPSAHTQTAYEDAAREAAAVGVELPSDHHHRYDARHLQRELAEFDVADFLLVPSAYAERTFVERGFALRGLVRHRYGFDPAVFGAPGRVERTDDALVAVFVGRGEPNKGLHHALTAWIDSGAADRGRLMLCGEILPAYRQRIADLLAHPSVEELGFVGDVGHVMRRADMLLLPSVSEGSALVTYEAQAAGCALLVSDAAGAPCEHLVQGLVHDSGDVATLTEHVRLVDRNRGLLRSLQEGALANAEGLTWASAGECLVRSYADGAARLTRKTQGQGESGTVVERSSQGGKAGSVAQVSAERWHEAQQWELAVWQEGYRKRGWKRLVWRIIAPMLRRLNWWRAWGDDWNHWWRAQFDGYRFLPSALGDCIELGCGPYTNIRLILQGRSADRVICSDPLADAYVTFRGRWLAEAYEAGRVEIEAHPIEESSFPPESFDLVVMINVLDHVRDADLCLRTALGLLRAGGIFVFGQDLSDEGDIRRHPYDVGHPIRLHHEDLEPYLKPLTKVLRKDLVRDEGRDPRLHYATLIYAGRKPL